MKINKRKIYIDNLRVLLASLIIIGHAAVAYGPVGYWYYNEASSAVSTYFLAFIVAFLQAFIIGLFFMLSAYFIPSSYSRKGAGQFFKDRLLRLGVPLVFYVLIINPVLSYFISVIQGKDTDFFSHYYQMVIKDAILDTGPLWFIQLLLILTLFYLLAREILERYVSSVSKKRAKFPSNAKIIAFIVFLSAAAYVVRGWFPIGSIVGNLQLSYLLQYIVFFTLGIYINKNSWLEKIDRKKAFNWSIIGSISVLCWPLIVFASGAFSMDITLLAGSFHWQSFIYTLWENTTGIAVTVVLIYLFRSRLDHQNDFFKNLSRTVFVVFIIHPLIIIPISFALSGLAIDPFAKFLIVSITGIPICFTVGYLLRKVRFLRKIF